MSRLRVCLAVLVLLGAFLCFLMIGCTIGGEPPDVPTAPAPGPMLPANPILPSHATPILPPQFANLPPASPREPLFTEVPTPQPDARMRKPVKAAPIPNARQIIEDANKQARLDVTTRGYFGQTGTFRYVWTPGKIYTIYLSPTMGTRITLPPQEILAHEVILSPDAFDVSSATIGTEVSRSTVLFIRPCSREESGCKPVSSVDVALVSESGRSYDLHLIIGSVSMVAVTWSIAPIMNIQLDEAPPLPGAQR